MREPLTIVWLRRDLRLSDHAALCAAAERGAVLPVFIWSPEEGGDPGAASRWWLHRSLAQLDAALRKLDLQLILREGPALEVLKELVASTGATGLVWNRCYEPFAVSLDEGVKRYFEDRLEYVASFPGYLLVEPWELLNQSGQPFRVFTPFWKRCMQGLDPGKPLPCPRRLVGPECWPRSDDLESWNLLPTLPWANQMEAHWRPGEDGAKARLQSFAGRPLLEYLDARNRPDLAGTSCLSPHLHFGELSPRQVWYQIGRFAEREGIARPAWLSWQFVAELGWREFAAYLLYHFPDTVSRPLRSEFGRFPWAGSDEDLRAWQQGRTGYPMVDAGMRELWALGWMHNRVRMIVASFLVKHLLVPWQDGASWFWDTLVDADLASNTLGWQWTAGCGADASPYFRIFNPITQGEKFDPDGNYVRRWVPELGGLPNRYLNRPWEAPSQVLEKADVKLGVDYPRPIVDHAAARERALESYAQMRSA